MSAQNNSLLTEGFLNKLFSSCISNDYALAVVVQHLRRDYLPDRSYATMLRYLRSFFKEHNAAPGPEILRQMIVSDRNAIALFDELMEVPPYSKTEALLEELERYIKQVKFQQVYREIGEAYNTSGSEAAIEKTAEFIRWCESMSITNNKFVDVIGTFTQRFINNREKHNAVSLLKPVTRFYIDQLDAMNNGRDLRGQLTCFLAPTGVGKSHAARWIGKNACQVDGLNVLHFQLEGSEAEVANAYSASLVSCNSFRYETGTLRDKDFEYLTTMLSHISGKLYIRSYPKFNSHVSTIDIKNGIQDLRKKYNIDPDVVIIDSIDLLDDSSGKKYSENGERHRRIAVANDLKDIASDEDVWMVGTYQATIENREWLNDEKNVLSEYNCAEAKGLARPMTHLITINQSDRERNEQTMRLFIAKSRFFKRGDAFKIATDYDNEQFYDRARTLTLQKIDNDGD